MAQRRPGSAFNLDGLGLPQNEQSVAVCRTRPRSVLMTSNDYRGYFTGGGDISGWYVSADGGRSVTNEGFLPPVDVQGATMTGAGDGVVAADDQCRLFASTIVVEPFGSFTTGDALVLYRSTPEMLSSCAGGIDPSCWPVHTVVATGGGIHQVVDKEWLAVGRSGGTEVVWAVWQELDLAPSDPAVLETAVIKAVRCDADLASCTQPIALSSDSFDFLSDVVVGPDGRTYVTWVDGDNFVNTTGGDLRAVIKIRVAEPGSTVFGPEHVVVAETQPLVSLGAAVYRIGPTPTVAVRLVAGRPRIFVTYPHCLELLVENVCHGTVAELYISDDLGATWSPPRPLSAGGDNFFISIADDPTGPWLAAAWNTTRFDPPTFHRLDVELAAIDPRTGAVVRRQRVTPASFEPDADPFLSRRGVAFIGDYIEVAAVNGVAYVGYTATTQAIPYFGAGPPLQQMDNFLAVRGLG